MKSMTDEVRALKSSTENVQALKRDVEALVVLQKERYLEAARAAQTGSSALGVTSPRAVVVPINPPQGPQVPRIVQYPRPQPPSAEGSLPGANPMNAPATANR
jgi:hypothetical protein